MTRKIGIKCRSVKIKLTAAFSAHALKPLNVSLNRYNLPEFLQKFLMAKIEDVTAVIIEIIEPLTEVITAVNKFKSIFIPQILTQSPRHFLKPEHIPKVMEYPSC